MRKIEIKLCNDDTPYAISVLLQFGRLYGTSDGLLLVTDSCVKAVHDALVGAKLVYPFYLYSKVD